MNTQRDCCEKCSGGNNVDYRHCENPSCICHSPEKKCRCHGPYTCKTHGGQFRYCSNAKCLCSEKPVQEKLPCGHTEEMHMEVGCGNPAPVGGWEEELFESLFKAGAKAERQRLRVAIGEMKELYRFTMDDLDERHAFISRDAVLKILGETNEV